MKFGEQFDRESVPQWRIHNIDYNSLKHHIKAHTTRSQGTAIAIPGHQGAALSKFEDELYDELCRQHDRVDLFVSSKADEIARRIQHLSNQIHALIVRCASSTKARTSPKRERRFAKYEEELLECGDEVHALQRFVSAQTVAFRKILKKYRKWTGSATLGARFREAILANPKSFTKRDFSPLQSQHDDLLQTIRAASPRDSSRSGSSSPPTQPATPTRPARAGEQRLLPSVTIVPEEDVPTGYWNEYDHGSEAGDDRCDEYAIYVNPDEDMSFPGISSVMNWISSPMKKMMGRSQEPTPDTRANESAENQPLLGSSRNQSTDRYGATLAPPSYFTYPPGVAYSDTDIDEDNVSDRFTNSPPHSFRRGRGRAERRGSYGYASSEEFPESGYRSLEQRRIARHRDEMLFWGTWGCYLVAFVLMGIATMLIMTGRHKMRLEVDAGVTVGIVTSLGTAVAALCLWNSRHESQAPSMVGEIAVWVTFVVACVGNAILLVLMVGKAP
ncbi:SPX domain-containing protein [Sordaria sp. MPI-SDFR-AT-0083]|nr:SPX domain-containing protein [Sordaria sp. MPI-SDFR-AT-0083]